GAVGTMFAPAVKAVEPTRKDRTPLEILAAFRGEIRPVRPTLLYRFWILIVTALMVLLPLLYLALVGLVGAAVVWHATHNLTLFKSMGTNKGTALVYITPIVAGVVAIVFLVKPLFARPPKGPRTRTLDPDQERLLFAFVERICSCVGAP